MVKYNFLLAAHTRITLIHVKCVWRERNQTHSHALIHIILQNLLALLLEFILIDQGIGIDERHYKTLTMPLLFIISRYLIVCTWQWRGFFDANVRKLMRSSVASSKDNKHSEMILREKNFDAEKRNASRR